MSEPHMPIKLKNTDNSALILQSTDGKWKDSIRDNVHSPKKGIKTILPILVTLFGIFMEIKDVQS